MHRPILSFFLLLAAIACGGSTSPSSQDAAAPAPGSSSPTVTIAPETAACPSLSGPSAVALKGVYDSSYPGLVTIFIVNHALDCSSAPTFLASGDTFESEAYVSFTLGATDASTVVTPGTYTGGSLTGGCGAYNAQCQELPRGGESNGGSVTLSNAGPSSYSGTFTFECPCGTYTGSFDAPLCSTPEAGTASDGGKACVP